MELVLPFYEKNNPEGACEKIVKESVYWWKKVLFLNNLYNKVLIIVFIIFLIKEDEVIDDITCIILFIHCPKE